MNNFDNRTVGIGSSISVEALSADPYPVYAALRLQQPVVWVPDFRMWLVTRYEDVRNGLLDTENLTVASQHSLLFDTFGEHMLTTDGLLHRRYRDAKTQGAFMPANVRMAFQDKIDQRVRALIDGFVSKGQADLRQELASRLPVLMMLDVFGFPDEDERLFRSWYDSFEAALSNHVHSESVRQAAAQNVQSAHTYFQDRIDRARTNPDGSFLSSVLMQPESERLQDEQIRRNALIIFFGGISTVEALSLNTLWALFQHRDTMERVQQDTGLIDHALDETIRWQAPVQSATRHAVSDIEIAGTRIPEGATVNFMLGSANRDETIFEAPDRFDIDRSNLNRHLGFATGPHLCLGRHLAKAEARTLIQSLFSRLQNLELDEITSPKGHEFRQPPSLQVKWDPRTSL
jgi:cytochrome P450